jgi:hypothetical protein
MALHALAAGCTANIDAHAAALDTQRRLEAEAVSRRTLSVLRESTTWMRSELMQVGAAPNPDLDRNPQP